MNDRIRSFEDLECWKAAREVRLFVARQVVPLLPATEKYRLTGQILDAARSITANIAEDYGRFHYLDNSKFCSNARGSACEVLDHLIAAHDEGMIAADLLRIGREKVDTALRLINGYMAYLKRSAAGAGSGRVGEAAAERLRSAGPKSEAQAGRRDIGSSRSPATDNR